MTVDFGVIIQVFSVMVAFVALLFTILTSISNAKSREKELEARLTGVEHDIRTVYKQIADNKHKIVEYSENEKTILLMQQEIQTIKDDIAEIKQTIKEEISAIKDMLNFTKNFK